MQTDKKGYYLKVKGTKVKTKVDKDIYNKYKNNNALHISVKGYVVLKKEGFFHRVIMGLSKHSPVFVDHIDGDPFNNTRENLRLAYQMQNMANQRKRKNCSSPYKGVWVKELKTMTNYYAEITLNYTKYRLGTYHDEEKAAMVYDKAALFFFGDFAKLNFPDKVHLHKKLRVQYVDFDSHLVQFVSEEELKLRAERRVKENQHAYEIRIKEREESFRNYISKVNNKEFGKVLKIKLFTDGYDYFYADVDDYDILKKYKFYYIRNRVCGISSDNKETKSIYNILGLNYPKYLHKDENIFNCTRKNIQRSKKDIDTNKLVKYLVNSGKKLNTSSKYLGVRKTGEDNYRSRISVDGKEFSLGTYPNEKFAAKVYDVAARRYFGDNCILNFPDYINENIKLPMDNNYIKPPVFNNRSEKSSIYAGVTVDKNKYIAKLGKYTLGRFSSEKMAALVVSYAVVITGLYRLDVRWLNFGKEGYKKYKNKLSDKVKKNVKNVLAGIKWS